ncbi:23S rRNA (cytosine1962-C5)-methyltransferase [Allopseudospirillum japonicum]|uniref:23S rRNA (Cytosine1962-C5)-methyltransferase n=1 Tax=Allopseudospirillum japonicum TaxID=64971 RepID=A0A1H6R396_9GAMM|nr:class I SAM-dependent rRNA methyltransferase [Allopseudospirillum japonicum]SEI47694.1 23S rRNA (cytosine1962-C5)-methyltransferase [Allopseudospirillum japonicum]
MSTSLPLLKLRKQADRRLRAGHLWIYSNEIETQATPLQGFQAGQEALVESAEGRALGVAYVNPHSLICARLISRDPQQGLSVSLFVHRIKQALALREACFHAPYYRLIYADSDLLPGLIVDRFGDVLAVQLNTAGMEQQRQAVLEALIKVLKPKAIVWRNDSSGRRQEGLDTHIDIAYGQLDDQVILQENQTQFYVPLLTGQKTGWFYDHRENRQRLRQQVAGLRVLDLFSYVGGWGIQAATAGAAQVLCVDSSETALAQVQANAALNQVANKVSTLAGDAFDILAQLKAADERFDVVIADPPAFIKRRKDIPKGEQAYSKLNREAMRLLKPNGTLVSASCSMHLSPEALTNAIRASARHLDRHAQIFFCGHQGADHPIHPAIAETEYLKAFMVRVYRD